MHKVSFISEKARGGYKQERRWARAIFVCVYEDQQELMAIYRIVGEKLLGELYRAAWGLEAIMKCHAETIGLMNKLEIK